jgi:branched-chain amino acid aminotransferase
MNMFLYQGLWVSGEEHQLPLNSRSYRYGDGFFESMRFELGCIQYADLHEIRIRKAAMLLKMELPDNFNLQHLELDIQEHLHSKDIASASVRCTFFREGAGLYAPQNAATQIITEVKPTDFRGYPLNESGLTVGLFGELTKNANYTSTIKTNSALTYVMAGIYAAENHWDECVIVNDSGRIAETVSSNIFMVNGDFITTPPLSEYCVDGIMRKVVIQLAGVYGYSVRENPITAIDLSAADEIFISNAVKGIQWVGEYGGKSYKNATSKKLSDLLNKPFTQS